MSACRLVYIVFVHHGRTLTLHGTTHVGSLIAGAFLQMGTLRNVLDDLALLPGTQIFVRKHTWLPHPTIHPSVLEPAASQSAPSLHGRPAMPPTVSASATCEAPVAAGLNLPQRSPQHPWGGGANFLRRWHASAHIVPSTDLQPLLACLQLPRSPAGV